MNVYAVVSEYNPFHSGHKYLIDKAREYGATHIVAIMGGHFLQRGDVSVTDKWTRSAQAMKSGVDLVIELPVAYACASAETFALGAVEIANAIGCVNNIIFGSECGNIKELQFVATAINSKEFKKEFKNQVSKGVSYPRAMQKTSLLLYGQSRSDILSSPNNTLGIEYIKAIQKTGSAVKPVTVERKGAGHDSMEAKAGIASATYIRNLLSDNISEYEKFIPEAGREILKSAVNKNGIANIKNGEKALMYVLRNMSIKDISELPDVTEGLENRIYKMVRKSRTVEEAIESIKTKRYTRARIRRIFIYALLGIKKKDQNLGDIYLRVLGFNSKGEEILKTMKATARSPVITNVSRAKTNLSVPLQRLLELDVKATDMYSLFLENPLPCGLDFTRSMIKI